MSALIEQLNFTSPVVRSMLGLLPHLSPPVVLAPGPQSLQPEGCLYVPSMKLVLAGAGGPIDPALAVAERIARSMVADVLVVSIRPQHATRAIRYDIVFVEKRRTEIFSDLLFWTLPDRLPAFVPVRPTAPAAVIGKSTLIPTDAMPFRDRAERAAGVARGIAEQRLSLWGEAWTKT
jgi:hypothetical protein